MPEHRVGSAALFLTDGAMKRLDLGGTAVLLARVGGQYYAVAGDCTHYGAPLEKGVLKEYCLMCPWHHAAFDVRSGERLEPPALNDLAHYLVRIDDGQIVVTLPQTNEVEPQGSVDPSDVRLFVIVGGGAAGNAAAEELRRAEYRGRILIFSATPNLPVDRPNLSKDYLAGEAQPEWIPLRPDEHWYTARGIELRLNTPISRVNPQEHTLTLGSGEAFRYDKLLLATGGTPRQLKGLPGSDLSGVFLLRELADSDRIIAAAEKVTQAVIIGASFIGMEAAASLAGGRKLPVTVIEVEAVPFARNFGEDVGRMFQHEHEKNGVQFRMKAQIDQIMGENGHVTGVKLKTGEVLPADFVVVGVGVRPATDFLMDSGLQLDDKDQSVRVNEHLQTNDPDIYAAGDIARYPDGSERGQRIEHWRVAEQHGLVAARNMLERSENVRHHVPFFWTKQWAIELRYVGHAEKWDEIVYRHGTPEKEQFIAFYMAGGKLLAAAGRSSDPEMDAIEFILQADQPLTPEQMRDESFDLVQYASKG